MTRLWFVSIMVLWGLPAMGQDCASIISLAKEVSKTTSSSREVQANANDFCSQYQRHRLSSGSSNFGASYKFLAASFSTGQASVDEVASRYCSAASNYQALSNAYESYVERIAPGAWSAYETCEAMQGQDVRFSVSRSIAANKLTVYGAYSPRSAATQPTTTIAYSATPDVSCKWNGEDAATSHAIQQNTAVQLICTRSDPSLESAVEVIWTGSGGYPRPLSIPWPAFRGGVKVNDLAETQARLDAATADLRKEIAQLKGQRYDARTGAAKTSQATPRGAHAHTSAPAAACPDGQVMQGIRIHYGGTCRSQCNADGGIVQSIEFTCTPIEVSSRL